MAQVSPEQLLHKPFSWTLVGSEGVRDGGRGVGFRV